MQGESAVDRDRLTQFLNELALGRESGREGLLPYVHAQLRTLAEKHLRDQAAGHTLQPTPLVHEAPLGVRLESLGA